MSPRIVSLLEVAARDRQGLSAKRTLLGGGRKLIKNGILEAASSQTKSDEAHLYAGWFPQGYTVQVSLRLRSIRDGFLQILRRIRY